MNLKEKITEPRLIKIDVFHDSRGTLNFLDDRQLPFEIKRIYYMSKVPVQGVRGGHAHRDQTRCFFSPVGKVEIRIECRGQFYKFSISDSSEGLLVPPMAWLEIEFLTEYSTCVVLASDYYDEMEYIRDKQEFSNLSKNLKDNK